MDNSSRRVRVLYTESNVDGTIGGSHFCLLHLVERLDRRRFEPLVLFYDDHALVPRFRQVAETRVEPVPVSTSWGHGSGGWARAFAPARRAANLARFGGLIARRFQFLRDERIGLVHLNNSITRHQEWAIASLLAGVPCIVHERGLNDRYSVLDKALARHVSLLVPVSRWVMDHMIVRGVPPDRIRVMYDGLDPHTVRPARTPEELRAEYGLRPGQPVIGIVGNVRGWKGQKTVVEAMTRVAVSHPDAVCFLVGAIAASDRPYRQELESILSQAGIAGNIRFTGYQRDPASFVHMMRMVIHASIEPEPFGMVVLEAMAQRKPVIGSRAGGVVEMVVDGETGYTYPPGDAAALASRIVELLDDPARAERMGEAGYARVTRDFTLDSYMRQIQGAYDAILAGRTIPPDLGIAAAATAHD